MLGHTPAESISSSISLASGNETRSRSHSQSEGNYWLLDAAEIQRLPLTRVILKLRNCPFPILGKRLDYRKVWRWRRAWDRWDGSVRGFTREPVPPDDLPAAPPLPPRTDLTPTLPLLP